MASQDYHDSVILNVDDNDASRYAKSRILTRAGFRVVEAASGGEAIKRAESDSPDLVLLDTKLPDINGFEVCRLLKRGPRTQTILILQTSASYIGIADKIRALDGGADNYLVEPVEPEELIANVKALLRLARVERELRDVDHRKDLFLATLAHELRNPLGPIRSAVELLRLLDPYAPEKEENARQTIIRQTDHLVRLVDDLLDVSRITQGKISLRDERIELKTFINAAIETATPIILGRQHVLDIRLPDEEIWIKGDSVRLTQIVGNLLHNAAKFTSPGGSLGIQAELQRNIVSIKVKDNGIGVPPALALTIFDMFAQAAHAPDRVQDGLGIGLSLVKTLAELHGGTVSLESAGTGQGSTFEVRLPVIASTAPAAKEPKEQERDSQTMRILVVDDNLDSAEIICALLELEGHSVRRSHTGGDAIESARLFQPDIVLLDIGLPDMSGYQVATQMRQLPRTRKLILIALTGYGQEEDKSRAISSGFDHHLVKPVTFYKLIETIRAAAE
ncbi:MAG: hybrid sensor histidine kinase/response regulator [Herminiimonas sp.]|nr:hybrid sensor histidine kinase/response regulator [Herminiimonas sp.]